MKNILEMKHLTKYYGKVLGIEDLTLSLKEGETFGFIGPNGAGKSTTIRSIMGLINKTSGTIFMNGKELKKDDLELKKMIGYLPSEIHLYEDFTVKEMLDYHESFYSEDFHSRRQELVRRFELDEKKKIETLSLGNLKKLGIVLAFLHKPKLLILDEPTSGLDPIMQQNFYDLLKEEKKSGTTIFYSTHVLSEVSKICDRVGFIKNGKLLKIETMEDLKMKELSFVTIESKKIDEIIEKLQIEGYRINQNTIRFQNKWSCNELIKKLSSFPLDKLLIEEATLEDIFLHYYE